METDGIVTRTTTDPVGVVVDRLLATLESRGIEVFAVVDHSGAAKRVGQELRETKLVIFGNPSVGTTLMRARPLIALDLPLKILIWEGDAGETYVSYNESSYLADRYEISDPFRLQTLASTGVLADLIVGSPEG
jgi:uncharacterized protein (DUF302 family)